MKRAMVAATWMALSPLAMAAPAPNAEVLGLISKLSGGKSQVVSTFPAAEIGMTGVVLKRGGDHVIVYVEPAGKYLVSGVVIGADGKNLSQLYNSKFMPKPDYAAMWSAASKTHFVEYGNPNAKKLIYVVGEANCGYCKRFHQDIKPLVEAGDVSVRWILMGFDPAADGKAAGVIAAANPKQAVEALYEKGETLPHKQKDLDKVKANHEFTDAFGVNGTPFILSRNEQGVVVATPGAVRGKDLEKLVVASNR